MVDSYDPGLCDEKAHGQQVLVKDKTDEEIILICVKDKGVYHWRPTFGKTLDVMLIKYPWGN